MRLVASVGRAFMNRGLESEDLIQEGAIGLQRAAELFDPARGYAFATFAYWWIRQSMTRALAFQTRTIKVSPKALILLGAMERHAATFMRERGRRPTDAESAEALGLSVAQLARLRDAAACRYLVALDAPIHMGDGTVSLANVIASPDRAPLDQLEQRVEAERLEQLLALLPEAQRVAVLARQRDQLPFTEIAALLQVRVSEARSLEQRGRNQLRLWWGEQNPSALPPPPRLPSPFPHGEQAQLALVGVDEKVLRPKLRRRSSGHRRPRPETPGQGLLAL